ncbi:PorT family protein [Solitalea sp. MAHUQ-68]|uniref:PorT family protein n=1 Tax=Solitalea agri TaxID=2953739 RepID=A0A9X2F350_9SPHI|nr:PorT family protein [Solitalea agri]MCO4293852.1 PorT family protein [Solitalea agri]
MKNKTLYTLYIFFFLGLFPFLQTYGQTQGTWYLSMHIDAGKAAKAIGQAAIESALNLEPEESDPDADATYNFGFDAGYQFKVREHVSVDAGVNLAFLNLRKQPTYANVIEDDYLFKQRNTALSAVIRPTYYFGSEKGVQFFGSVGVKMTKCYTRIFYSELSYEDDSVLPRYLSKSNAESAEAPFNVHLVPAAGFRFNSSGKQSASISFEWEKTPWDISYNNLRMVRFGVPSNYQFDAKGVVSVVFRINF